MNSNFDHYKVFYQVAVSGNITEAAERLHVSQPAVTITIRKLENSLGCTLFTRSRSGVKLTADGQALFEKIGPACELIFSAELDFAGKKRQPKAHPELVGTINTTASEITAKLWLIPRLQSFREIYPNVSVNIEYRPTFSASNEFDFGKIDFAILNTPFEMRDSYKTIEVGSFHDVFVCGSAYKELIDRVVEISELAKYPLVLLVNGTSVRVFLHEYFSKHGLDIEPAYQFGSMGLLLSAIEHNLGVGTVAYEASLPEIKTGRVHQIKLADPLPPRKIVIVTSRERPLGLVASTFLSHVTD